jgi:hypothetical protein
MNIDHIKNIANYKRSVEIAAALLDDCDTTSKTCFNAFGNQVQYQKSPDSRFISIIDQRDQLRRDLESKYLEYLQAARWGMEELESISDAKMRKILYLRFIREDQWAKIAKEIGGKATSDSVKKSVERFLDQNGDKKMAQ